MEKNKTINISELEFQHLKQYLHNVCGIDVPSEKRYLFETRLGDLLAEEKCANFEQLHRKLDQSGESLLKIKLIERMTTNETSFMRDDHPFKVFRHKLLDERANWQQSQLSHFLPKLRIWSAGCSSGQEPYSLAMLVHQWLPTQKIYQKENIHIIASDISDRMLLQARNAIYDTREIERGLSFALKQKYLKPLDKSENKWQVVEEIRNMVYFCHVNLATDFSGLVGLCDFVFLRNVIIYFSDNLKYQILNKIHQLLKPKGILFLGSSENLFKQSDDYEMENSDSTIYYRVKK